MQYVCIKNITEYDFKYNHYKYPSHGVGQGGGRRDSRSGRSSRSMASNQLQHAHCQNISQNKGAHAAICRLRAPVTCVGSTYVSALCECIDTLAHVHAQTSYLRKQLRLVIAGWFSAVRYPCSCSPGSMLLGYPLLTWLVPGFCLLDSWSWWPGLVYWLLFHLICCVWPQLGSRLRLSWLFTWYVPAWILNKSYTPVATCGWPPLGFWLHSSYLPVHDTSSTSKLHLFCLPVHGLGIPSFQTCSLGPNLFHLPQDCQRTIF